MMNVILLSGGGGKRLWPISDNVRAKQFLQIFETESGEKESMLQRGCRRIKQLCPDAKIIIASSAEQLPLIREQLGDEITVSPEPCRRDTFPAIALAASMLHDKFGADISESVVICPIDADVDEDYYLALQKLSLLTESGNANLTLMGITPSFPSEAYGYILPYEGTSVSAVAKFYEKPDRQKACEYISAGALWNSGIFGVRLGYILEQANRLLGTCVYSQLYSSYSSLKPISFDYAVAERESSIQVMRFAGMWRDIGTWDTFSELINSPVIGNGIISDDCENVSVLNELDIPIICLGGHDLVIAAGKNGILIADKSRAPGLKPYVDKITQEQIQTER